MSEPPLLEFSNLSVFYGARTIVDNVSFALARGETAALVGASGSGKSQTVLAALRLLPPQARASGRVAFEGEDLLSLPERRLNAIRGRRVAMIFQEPMSALDPLFTVGSQIAAVLRLQAGFSRRQALTRAAELLDLVGIDAAKERVGAFPHQLSGGQRQRVSIAMAIACEPDALIADEPTTALDVTVAARILDLLGELRARLGLAMIFISHDLQLVRRLASRVYVMEAGCIVEAGATEAVFRNPQHAATQGLVITPPSPRAPRQGPAPEILNVENLGVAYKLRGGWFGGRGEVKVLEDVSLSLKRGRTLGIVGESGAGKSTLGRAILRLVPASGIIRFEGRDIGGLDEAALRPRRRAMQMVFQDPYGALSPRMRIGDIVSEGLLIHEPAIARRARDVRAAQALEEVSIDPARRDRPPREFSGGQRQRIAIARAIILRPRLVVLDEPTSALDRATQMDILRLLRDLQEAHGLAYILISHDLTAIRAMADDIAVMKSGRIVEQGPAAEILGSPRDPYTRLLIEAHFDTYGARRDFSSRRC
ncbi:ABC transporter related [Methylocella silvestris BL2]|uniref:ABC transporter related n=1 Tax=Methylocella silvestris (strain DSM 15510 / CIP 108128 / LMG 27833 / NCIMB 13906 / BL2) TaxID=395965 RepID=B8ESM6_METSB|nr:dipeptide ABC transporter ATP-binding protein [Methylocella silvestris]ACK50361.1 ABC transporter related [Methylocella silvestris BL2]